METEESRSLILQQDDATLTGQLFDKISVFHSVPRLRQKLVKIAFADFESHVSAAHERDLVYLVSALAEMLGLSLDPALYPGLPRELGEYLRHCDCYGLTIHHFLSRSVKPWEEIRPKYQELARSQFAEALRRRFTELPSEPADCISGYLLIHSLVRLIPPFPFHAGQKAPWVVAVRAQSDLTWSLASQPADYFSTLQTHFPEIVWREQCAERKLWFAGVRLLSQFSPKTASVLKNALAGLNHQSTSLVRNRKKLLHVAFFSEADANLFKFNLDHHAKLAGTFYEPLNSSLAEYREGYPGLSGFINEELRLGMTAGED
jgi:hypothetical protein